jgi:hypothetical protein
LALTGAIKQLSQLQDSLINGGVSVGTAMELLAATNSTLAGLDQIQSNPDVTVAQTKLLLTLSDVYSELGLGREALSYANKAKNLAMQLVKAGNTEAPRLIYGQVCASVII